MNKEEKLIISGRKARLELLNGVTRLASVVKETLGPRGRNILFDESQNRRAPTFSKDGVGVARRVVDSIQDPYENVGARAVLNASELALKKSGDGTTTSIVLTEVIYKEGVKAVEEGCNPIVLKRSLEKYCKLISEELYKLRIPYDKLDRGLFSVANVSANFDEEISKTVSDIFDTYGVNIKIALERSFAGKTYFDHKDGYELENCGPVSSMFSSEEGSVVWAQDGVRVLLFSEPLTYVKELDAFFNDAFVNKQAKIIIIAPDFSTQIVTSLALNVKKNGVCINLVKLKGPAEIVREMLEDLAALTNTVIFGKDEIHHIQDLEFNMLGIAEKVISRPDFTLITGSKNNCDKVNSYVNMLKERLDQGMDSYNPSKEYRLKNRINKLTDGICNIYIDAVSEQEYIEKKEHYDDCVSSVKLAMKDGVLPGGGSALIKISKVLPDEKTLTTEEDVAAVSILRKALFTPLITLLKNCGIDDIEKYLEEVLNSDISLGFDLNEEEPVLTDLLKKGIVDAASIPINSLVSAVSSAGMLLSTSVCVIQPPPIISPYDI